ncbi:golgin subfamily A member 6-like protein 22 [Nerophis ophidion]|uniref:golgin subfamily A member 6-like protein 22 n=1 Tax=Nerophis ophidion TaxID=159077 RepID=UPI002ADF6943|nr:golgin subfamily A member 6-like protein 22 [Nerophis ophidion]XP_061777824.1 golgin subfamily A member 6-like protein 22 [Nerophis ophidion]
MDNKEERISENTDRREFSNAAKADYPRRPHQQWHQGKTTEGGHHRPGGLKRALYYSENTNRELAAQNVALREQMDSDRRRHHEDRQKLHKALDEARTGRTTPEMEQKLREKENEMSTLKNALAVAQAEAVQARKYWMEEHELLKAREDGSESMVAAVNAEWQQCWLLREQETAAQLQAQWENMQWQIEEMEALFNSKLENMQRHSMDTTDYFKTEMERLQWHMGCSMQEKDEIVAKLTNENCILVAENGAVSGQLLKLEEETAELQRRLYSLTEDLKGKQDAKKAAVGEEPPAAATSTKESDQELQEAVELELNQDEVSNLHVSLEASRKETANVRKYWMEECEQLRKTAAENTKKTVATIDAEWQLFKSEWERMQTHMRQTLQGKDDLLAKLQQENSLLAAQNMKMTSQMQNCQLKDTEELRKDVLEGQSKAEEALQTSIL